MATSSAPVGLFRVLTTVHVAAWCVAVLPPSVGVRAVGASVVATGCAFAVGLGLVAAMNFPPRMRSALLAHAAASSFATAVIVVSFVAAWPDAVVVGAGGFVLVTAIHLLVWVGLADVTVAFVPMLLRPSRFPAAAPWPAVAQALAVGNTGLLLGIIGTSLAPLFGGIVMAGLGVGGWCVGIFGFGFALLEAARAAPSLLPAHTPSMAP